MGVFVRKDSNNNDNNRHFYVALFHCIEDLQ
jgi:hypothetical protein